jgi:hypothetical protein
MMAATNHPDLPTIELFLDVFGDEFVKLMRLV